MARHKGRFDRLLLYIVSFLVLGHLSWAIFQKLSKETIAYIDINRLLNEFQMKKDLERSSSGELLRIKSIIDSLNMIKTVSSNPDGTSPVDTQLMYAGNAFQQYYAASNQEISKRVWDRLNPLLQQYGQSNRFSLIIGANGQGTVLYGHNRVDITDDVIRFVNSKYEKGN